MAIFPVWRCSSEGSFDDAARIKVSGPGQKALASLSAVSGQLSTAFRTSAAVAAIKGSGLPASLPLTAKMRLMTLVTVGCPPNA